jgi:hypothetical protein
MGDDVDAPHEMLVELPDPATIANVVGWLDRSGPPASVQGGSTWALRVSGRVVAVLSKIDRRQQVETIGDQTLPVTMADEIHLDYLLADDIVRLAAFARVDPYRVDLRQLARYTWDR